MGRVLRAGAFWVGVASAGVLPLVGVVWSWFYPPVTPKLEPRAAGLMTFALSLLNSMGDGIMVMVRMAGLAVVAVLASVMAFTAAWFAHESRQTKLLCLLPVTMVGLMYGLRVAIGD